MKIQAVFNEIKQKISKEIDGANTSILIALAYFNDKDLFDLLCQKATLGIKIEIIVSSEDDNYLNGILDYQRLVICGGQCLFTDNIDNGLMHHKFCLIDRETIITGSYNWTNKAATSNYENIIILKDNKELFDEYLVEFEKLKGISNSKLSFTNENITFKHLASKSTKDIFDKNVGFGYKNIDKIIHGFQKSGLYVISSRPSNGSTTMILNTINNLSQENKSIILYSLDLSGLNIIRRLTSIVSEIPIEKIASACLDIEDCGKIEKAQKELSKKNIFIDNTPDLTIRDIEFSIFKQKTLQDIDLVVIDYLELMKVDRKSDISNKFQRDYELDWIVRELKRISQVSDIPILLVSHMSRQDNRDNNKSYKLPQINDVQNYIEQYSDVITIVHRPELYHITEDAQGNSLLNTLEISIAKNKFGSTYETKVYLDNETLKISNDAPEDVFSPYSFISSKMNSFYGETPPLGNTNRTEDVPF